jgi:hypothetical protein
MLLAQDLLERRAVGMPRERPGEVPPTRLLLLEPAEQPPRLVDVAVAGCVEERKPQDVGIGKATCAPELGASSLRPVRRPIYLRALDEAAQLDDRAFPFLDAKIEHALPRLATARDDDDARAALPAPVAARRLGGVEGRQQPLGERALRPRSKAAPIWSQASPEASMLP